MSQAPHRIEDNVRDAVSDRATKTRAPLRREKIRAALDPRFSPASLGERGRPARSVGWTAYHTGQGFYIFGRSILRGWRWPGTGRDRLLSLWHRPPVLEPAAVSGHTKQTSRGRTPTPKTVVVVPICRSAIVSSSSPLSRHHVTAQDAPPQTPGVPMGGVSDPALHRGVKLCAGQLARRIAPDQSP